MIRGRVVLVPGNVISAADGQEKFVGAFMLSCLYDVPLRRCLVWNPSDPMRDFSPRQPDVLLYPQSKHENYSLPQAARDLLS